MDLPHPLAGSVPQVGTPIRFSVTPAEYGRPPPLWAKHTAEVLRERLALDPAAIAALAARGVIGVRA
jgi:crotonobetainyl-CoA:carnitine CoA-transferase CaiB-like acyl-CoA transferase